MKVEFFRHGVSEIDIENVAEAMRGRFLTTGEWVARFERDLAEFAGRKHAVGVTSGTAGLHLALAALGIGPGDEVITTPMSFVATANAVVMTGARPVFVDVEPNTGNIDASEIEAAVTEHTKAILPVHLYGVLCDMKAIAEIARRRGLAVVEDSAHALEAGREDIHPGDRADAAVFSFYATKSITSGEGGAVVTDDGATADRLRRLRLHGMTRGAAERYSKAYEHYDVPEVGWKYNMSNIQAAMLVGQLPRVVEMRETRERLARYYIERFADVPGVEMPATPEGCVSGRHLFTIWVDPARRDDVLAGLAERGVGAAVNYRPIHLYTYYRNALSLGEGSFPRAERIGASTISLPFYPSLSEAEADYVVRAVDECLKG
jgi:UDP-4-amino-4-deoxy-L-arabinose-oxoglutarate aminotransferase